MTNHIVSCRLADLDLESLNHKLNSLDWISHASRDAASTQCLMFRVFRRSWLGFALWRLCFFGANYVADFKKQCLLPACQPENQPLIHKQTLEGDKCWAAFWYHLCCCCNWLKKNCRSQQNRWNPRRKAWVYENSKSSFILFPRIKRFCVMTGLLFNRTQSNVK